MKITRLAPGATHMFGEPGMAERIVDFVTEWDYWQDMDRPLDAERSRYDVLLK